MVMLFSHHKYECTYSDWFLCGRYDSSYGQWLYQISSTLTSGQNHQVSAQFTIVHDIYDWKLRARLLARTHVSQMAQIKLAHDSPIVSVCVFFVCLFVCFFWPWSVSLFIYLFIRFINLLLLIYNTAQCKFRSGKSIWLTGYSLWWLLKTSLITCPTLSSVFLRSPIDSLSVTELMHVTFRDL